MNPDSVAAGASLSPWMGIGYFFLGLIALAVMGGLYMLPFIIAKHRGHHAANGILLVNILLGWTVVGWFVSFIWAYSAKPEQPAPQPASETTRRRMCLKCGAVNELTDSFCRQCGAGMGT